LIDTLTKPFAEFVGALRTGKEAVEQGAEVEPGTSNHDRKVSAGFDLGESLSRQTGILAGCDVASGIHNIEQVVGCAGALDGAWLRGSDLELANHGDRITIHYFAMKALREGDGK
jgi:hypothetical protein